MMRFQNFGPQTPPKSDGQNFCPLKLVFLGLKFGRNHVFRQFLLYLPPPIDIHGWKATDLSFDLAPSDQNFMHPTSRQNFGDGPGQTPKLILTLCL